VSVVAGFAALYVFVSAGLGGEPEYEQRFQQQADAIAAASHDVTDEAKIIEIKGAHATREEISAGLQRLAKTMGRDDAFAAVFIGHGTFDGEEYRYNIPGLDLTGMELGKLLDAIPARSQLIVNATSASGILVDRWKHDGRIIITATKSGGERNATRFAEYWVRALKSVEADTDKNGTITAGEAYSYANRKVTESFTASVTLATEHSRIDGTGAERFAIARIEATPETAPDPAVAALYDQRTAADQTLDALKRDKPTAAGDDYYQKLESALVEIARIDRAIDQHAAARSAPATRRKKP
jgi:hypothetical protein